VLPAVHDSADARTFMRFFAPSAQPIHREQPFSGFAYPSHVASLRLPCASTPYSLDGLPGVLSTRRALGASPYRALPDRDRQRLSAGHPLMRLATDRSRQTLSLLLFLHLPKIGSLGLAPRTNQLRLVPLGSMVRDAFGALGIAAAAASLQGFYPSAGWGSSSPDFSACDVPGSLGLHPPWGIPLPSLGLTAVALGLTTASVSSECALPCGRVSIRLASSGIPGKRPLWHRTLCFKFQRARK
jgi:hypothetical protein